METSTYIILALLAIFLFGPVSLSTPLRHSVPLRPSVTMHHPVKVKDMEMAAPRRGCLNVPRESDSTITSLQWKRFTEQSS